MGNPDPDSIIVRSSCSQVPYQDVVNVDIHEPSVSSAHDHTPVPAQPCVSNAPLACKHNIVDNTPAPAGPDVRDEPAVSCDDDSTAVRNMLHAGSVYSVDGQYDVREDDDDVDDNDVYVSTGKYVIQEHLSIRDQLARWAVVFSVPAVAVSALLKILLVYGVIQDLPKDCRTLLKTARQVETKKIRGGEYFHFGIKEGICSQLENLKKSVFDGLPDVLRLVISSDGLPVFKSVNTHVWPISACLFLSEACVQPFTIGVFYGEDKLMKVHDFLEDFVRDFRDCSTDGFLCRQRQFKVSLHCIVADAPARSMMKNVKGHGSTYGCERCMVFGVKLGGMTFNNEDAELRTDASLLNPKEVLHRKGNTPLSAIGVKLVSHFVLDYMHLVLLGVMRKLLYLWLEGEVGTEKKLRKYRLTQGAGKVISAQLTSYIETCPKEFARKPRSLNSFRMFKATELRTLLLYTGVVAFRCGVIRNEVYDNFLLLSCAMRILLHPKKCKQPVREDAHRWLRQFVKSYRELYGAINVVYNVHNLIHLQEDNILYGCLDNVNTFPFENYLQTFKKMIRHGHNTMQQLVRRLDELRRYKMHTGELFPSKTSKKYLHAHCVDMPPRLQRYAPNVKRQYKAIDYGGVRFSVFDADSCIRLMDGSVGKIVNVLHMDDDSTLIVCRQYSQQRPFFYEPVSSDVVGICEVHDLTTCLDVVEVEVCKKAWLLPQTESNWFVAIDLL